MNTTNRPEEVTEMNTDYDINFDTADGGWWVHASSNWVPTPGVGPFTSLAAAEAWAIAEEG